MLVGRQNPRGGPKLKSYAFPLKEDQKTKEFGLLIGYLENGEYILLPLSVAEEVATRFADNLGSYRKMMNKIKPKISFKQRVFTWMFGRKAYMQLKDEYEEGD